jgi:subtilase family serine protease
LPDLVARGIRQIGEGDQAFFCVAVQNLGERASALFPLTVLVNGQVLRTLDPMAALEPGETSEHCAYRPELPANEHMLTFAVDASRRIAEMSESNNIYEWKIPARQAAQASAQSATGRAGLADLLVREIRVRGEKPSGARDCDPGKNDVTVKIANDGAASAAGMVVRLVIDDKDDEARERNVSSLEPGKETEVRFDDVQLSRGERELAVTVDAKKAVAEDDEGNNEMTLKVNCRDE